MQQGAWTEDSFDHLVGAVEQRGRDRDAQRLRSLEVDHEFIFRRLLDGKICRVCTFEDFANINTCSPIEIQWVCSVAHEASGLHVRFKAEYAWQLMLQRNLS